jgi:hypothetical protein
MDFGAEPSKEPTGTEGQITSEAVALDVQQLKSEIQALKKENQGFIGWARRWGSIVGLIAGLVAIPNAIVQLYIAVFTHPRTSAARGPSLSIGYDPTAGKIKLAFNFVVSNSGTADDTIKEMWGSLTPPTYSSPLVSFDSSKFHIVEKGQDIPVPFTVAKATSREFQCVLEAPLEANTLPHMRGDWIAEITLAGQKKDAPMKLRYELPIVSKDIDQMKKSSQTLNFLNPH